MKPQRTIRNLWVSTHFPHDIYHIAEEIDLKEKVLFRIMDEDGTSEVETLWAINLGADRYKLENSPFNAYDVSWEDIVFAQYNSAEGFPTLEKVVKKSGNRTVRVGFDPPIEEGCGFDKLLEDITALGCSFEGATRRYIFIHPPPNVVFEEVTEFLVKKK